MYQPFETKVLLWWVTAMKILWDVVMSQLFPALIAVSVFVIFRSLHRNADPCELYASVQIGYFGRRVLAEENKWRSRSSIIFEQYCKQYSSQQNSGSKQALRRGSSVPCAVLFCQ